MKRRQPSRVRDTVYVVGAGFSKGLGYPLTSDVLTGVWDRLPPEPRNQLSQIIAFHHPDFDPAMRKSFPDIEQLLTEIEINIQFFDSSRPAEGRFAEAQLRETRKVLLSSVEAWFHDLYKDALEPEWLRRMVAKMQTQNAAIISFNWDLVLDHTLFGGALN